MTKTKNVMKNILKLAILMLVIPAMIFTSCEPSEDAKPDIGESPSKDELSFTMTQDEEDEFNYILKNQSDITGIASWNIDGSRKSGDEVEHRFPLPGEYEIELTIATKGGQASISKAFEQEKLDSALFDDPVVLTLADFGEGKTWAMDSLSEGHIGVGPADSETPEWWEAQPLDKAGVEVLYEDRMTFKIEGFEYIYENNGASYVKDFRADDPAYSNPEERDTDYKVDFDPPEAGWNVIVEEGEDGEDVRYLELTTGEDKPIFTIFDVGAVDNKYEITHITEDELWLRTIGGDGIAWYYKFIRAGYEHNDD